MKAAQHGVRAPLKSISFDSKKRLVRLLILELKKKIK